MFYDAAAPVARALPYAGTSDALFASRTQATDFGQTVDDPATLQYSLPTGMPRCVKGVVWFSGRFEAGAPQARSHRDAKAGTRTG